MLELEGRDARADAAGALEYVKTFWILTHHTECEVLDPTLRTSASSVIVVDAKSLCDAVKKKTCTERRMQAHSSGAAGSSPDISIDGQCPQMGLL